jgi:hypothetical protein
MSEDILSMKVSDVPRAQLLAQPTPAQPAGRLSFSQVNPKLQIAWDSVSSGVAKKCPRKYQYQIVEGWQGKHVSAGSGGSLHLRYGQLYHRVLEVYDHFYFEHEEIEGIQRHEQAMRFALRDLAEGCQDHVLVQTGEHVEGMEPGEVMTKVARVWWDPSAGLSEDAAKKNTKTVPNLFRTAIWYMDQFGFKDPCKTVRLANGKPAVELSFRYEMGFTFKTGEELFHCGHLDRLVELGDLHYVLDRKTSKNTITGNSSWGYFAKFNPDNQMSGYTFGSRVALAMPVAGVIIDAAQIAKGFSAFERGFTMRTEGQLDEWRNDFVDMVQRFEGYAERGYWPMNDTACDDYGGCAFRNICSKDPSVRQAYLEADFVKRPWDPLQVRGDI